MAQMELGKMMPKLISTIAVCAVIGGIGGAVFASTNTRPAPAYDMSRSADRALATFERRNPQCEMWSNWQKLCSRTGKAGSTHCRTDPLHRVAPSKPFCALPRYGVSYGWQPAEHRFCEEFFRGAGPSVKDGERAESHCKKYAHNRPFSGEFLSQMQHPACDTWGTGEPGRDLCSESGAGGLPRCANRTVQSQRNTEPFVCTKWNDPKPCAEPIGGRRPAEPDEETGVYIYDSHPMNRTAVWGSYCRTVR